MTLRRLLEVEDEYDFSLVGICCHAKDYRLCWEINNCLNIDLVKSESIPLEQDNNELGFTTSRYFDEENHLHFALISNKQNGKYLVPEQPQLDYFLKISGPQHYFDLINTKQMIQNIDLVLTALEVSPKILKSKPNLVF